MPLNYFILEKKSFCPKQKKNGLKLNSFERSILKSISEANYCDTNYDGLNEKNEKADLLMYILYTCAGFLLTQEMNLINKNTIILQNI